MKIFGWMHRKLHLGTTEYHRVAHRNSPDIEFGDEASEKNGTLLAPTDQRPADDMDALLLLPHMLLTIGTFGHSTPPQQQQISPEEQNHEEEQVPTCIAKTASATELKHELVIGELSTMDKHDLVTGELATMDIIIKQEGIVEEQLMSEEPLLKEEKVEKRTTLADLFAAEPVSTNDCALPVDKLAADKRKIASPNKDVKKIKKGKDQSLVSTNATKKIHQLITKMLKKKIHPDVARADLERRGRRGGASNSDGIKVDLLLAGV